MDIEWKKEDFEHIDKHSAGHWNILANQIAFLESVAMKHNITEPIQWGKITNKQLIEEGGSSLLCTYKSLFKLLSHCYPGILFLI